MGDLEEFIVEYTPLAEGCVRLLWSKYLDDDDISEIVHEGLWRAWRVFDSTKECSINTLIYTIVRNYAFDVIRRKRRYKEREIPIHSSYGVYHTPEDFSENYTTDEWSYLKDYFEGKTNGETLNELKLDHHKLKAIRRIILKRRCLEIN